jgi:hypothetical protein
MKFTAAHHAAMARCNWETANRNGVSAEDREKLLIAAQRRVALARMADKQARFSAPPVRPILAP